jgi:hypothetical protein
MIKALPGVLWCLIWLHSSDGQPIWITSEAITVLKPLLPEHRDHLAKGTETLVYTAGKVFGVREDEDAIERLIKSCPKGP